MKKYQKNLGLILTLVITFLTLVTNTPAKAASKSDVKDAFLKGLSVKYGTMAPEFKKDVESYNVYADATATKILIKAAPNNSKAAVTVNSDPVKNGETASVELNGEVTTVLIVVTSQDGTVTKNYTLSVEKASENDANLIDIKLDPQVEGFVFNKETLDYTVNVVNEVQSIKVAPYAADSRSSITVNGKKVKSGSPILVKLTTGENLITINVKNSTSKTEGLASGEKVYSLKVVRSLNTNSNLKSITVSPGKIDKKFNKTITDYTVTLKDTDKKVSIVPIAEVKTSNIAVLLNGEAVASKGNKYEIQTQNPGIYNVSIIVEAEDKAAKTTYNFKIVKPDVTDNTLSGIVLGEGTLNPVFSKDVEAYNVLLDNSVKKLKIESAGTNSSSKIKTYLNGKQIGADKVSVNLLEGENLVEIKVYSNDSLQQERIYKIVIDRLPKPMIKIAALGYNTDQVLPISKITVKEEKYQIDLSGLKDTDVINSITINSPENSYVQKIIFQPDKEIVMVKGDNVINDLSLLGLVNEGQEATVASLKKLADKKGYVTLYGKVYGTYKENEISKDITLLIKLNTKAIEPGKVDSIIGKWSFNLNDLSSLDAEIDDKKVEFEFKDIDESLRIINSTVEVSKECSLFLGNKKIELKAGANTLTLADFGIIDNGNDGVQIKTLQEFGNISMYGIVNDGVFNYSFEMKIEVE